MENAADALKMAGAAMLFIIAFSITMIMFNRAKTSTEAVLDNLTISNFMPRVNPLAGNQTRKVGIETIIPTLYRYCQSDENPTIIIRKDNQNSTYTVMQIFDTEIEAIARRDFDPSSTEQTAYYNRLKDEYGTDSPTKPAYLYGAPWVNQQSKHYYFERINAYIYGSPSKHMPVLNADATKSIYAQKGNTLMALRDRDFIESYVEYNTGGQVEKDEYGEEIVTRPASKKTQIIYTYK